MISIARSSLADVELKDTDKPGFRRFIKRVPLGVVLVIAPWKSVILFFRRHLIESPQTANPYSHSQLPVSYFHQLRPSGDPCRQFGDSETFTADPGKLPSGISMKMAANLSGVIVDRRAASEGVYRGWAPRGSSSSCSSIS